MCASAHGPFANFPSPRVHLSSSPGDPPSLPPLNKGGMGG